MGIADLGKGETPEPRDDDDRSVSYIYVYERGRAETEDWPPDKQEAMARAYEVVSDGGIVRTTFKNNPQYINLHDGMGHFFAALAEALEDQNYTPVLEFVLSEDPEVTSEILRDYFAEHPEVLEELQGGIEA